MSLGISRVSNKKIRFGMDFLDTIEEISRELEILESNYFFDAEEDLRLLKKELEEESLLDVPDPEERFSLLRKSSFRNLTKKRFGKI